MDSNGTEFVYFCQPTKKNDSPHSFSSEISFVPTNWSIKATSEGFSIREISSKKLQSSSSNTGFPSKGDGNKNTYQDNKNGSLRYLNKPWVLTLLNCRLLTRKNPGKPSFQLLFLAEVPDVVRPSPKIGPLPVNAWSLFDHHGCSCRHQSLCDQYPGTSYPWKFQWTKETLWRKQSIFQNTEDVNSCHAQQRFSDLYSKILLGCLKNIRTENLRS